MWILSPTEIASSFCCIVSPRVVSFSIPPLPFTSSPTSSRKPSATESPINASRNNFDEKELPVDDADEFICCASSSSFVVVVSLATKTSAASFSSSWLFLVVSSAAIASLPSSFFCGNDDERERDESNGKESLVQFVFRVFFFFVATLNQVSEKTGREREKERQKARAQTSGHALSTKKNGRRVRAFDRRGERLCAVTFLIPLFFLLLFCVRRRRGESVFKLRRVSDPSFVRFFFPRTKFY